MSGPLDRSGQGLLRFTAAPRSSSFVDFLSTTASELLPGPRLGTLAGAGGAGGSRPALTHGTTIVAATFADGVVMAGDRRGTMGNLISQRDIEKVFPADEYSLVGIAGTAGIAIELVRLFQVELEHYEKIEGTPLTLDGKANRLATMIRGNLAAAMQGLAVVPLFAGYDLDVAEPAAAGKIYSYDATGGRYPEQHYHSVGSGSLFRQGLAEEALASPTVRGGGGRGGRRGAVRRRRRRLRDRRPGPAPPDLPDGLRGDRRRYPPRSGRQPGVGGPSPAGPPRRRARLLTTPAGNSTEMENS